jgi:hypothetical protein
MMGSCDFIVVPEADKSNNNILQKYFTFVAFGVPFVIIFVSYTIIWIKVAKHK